MSDKPESLFDVRTLRRNLEEGLITREELDAWLANLPDEADKAEETVTRMVASAPAQGEEERS